MSLQQAAKYLQSKGRGDDSVLVHMTPKEVKSLQAVAMAHGGSLSINPHTGLPEAGFLDSMLPMIVGAGITAATGGAAAPWMLGLGVGGLETLRTGNIGKGVMAGLGAYGGAGLAGGLMGAATAAQTPTAANLQSNIDPALLEGMSAPQVAATGDAAQRAAMLGEGVGALGNQAGRTGFMGEIGGGKGLAATSLAAAAPMLMGGEDSGMPAQKGSGPNPYKYTYETGVASPFPGADPAGIENNYFPNARYVSQPSSALPMAGGGIADALTPGQPVMYAARGGEAYSLGDYSDGGRLLRGPGDGVSDSIPATIADKRPARLADGEFVVPARIVSELGNGSTEAGARKLYAMMDRVQKARAKTVGKGKVAKDSKSDKHLPA